MWKFCWHKLHNKFRTKHRCSIAKYLKITFLWQGGDYLSFTSVVSSPALPSFCHLIESSCPCPRLAVFIFDIVEWKNRKNIFLFLFCWFFMSNTSLFFSLLRLIFIPGLFLLLHGTFHRHGLLIILKRLLLSQNISGKKDLYDNDCK